MKIGRVYKIIALEGNDVYVGSTFNTIRDRFQGHKDAHKRGAGCSVNQMFNKYGVKGCKMILIKEYEVIDRNHLEVFENLWIKKLEAINKNEPCGGLLAKYREKFYRMKYRERNKEIIKDRKRTYREQNKEKINQYAEQYREQNKEKINQFREENKDTINEKKRQNKFKCECGSEVRVDAKSRHLKTKKHNNFVSEQQLPKSSN